MLALVVLFFAILHLGGAPFDHLYLNNLEKTFDTIEHPSESRFVKRMKAIDSYGGGNSCLFHVGEFRSSTLSRGEVREWYERHYEKHFERNLSLRVDFLNEESCTADWHNSLCFSWLKRTGMSTYAPDENMYLVTLIDSTSGNGGRLHCY